MASTTAATGGAGGPFSPPTSNSNIANNNTSMMMSEADTIILPPPTPVNPIPSLPAAIRVDNQEQLLQLLSTDPTGSSSPIHNGGISGSFRQLLVFGNENLRTLLLRQVICGNNIEDVFGTAQKISQNKANTKKNWQGSTQFHFPKALQPSIVGTQVMLGSNNERIPQQHIDVMTYFLRPWDNTAIQAVLTQIRNSNMADSHSPKGGMGMMMNRSSTATTTTKNYNIHHRLVFIPHITASVSKAVQDTLQGVGVVSGSGSGSGGGSSSSNNNNTALMDHISLVSLQMDIFPLESDLLSLEYHLVQTPDTPPSEYITTCARSLLKIQDVIGKIPRIQSMAQTGEEVLQKLLAMTVEDDDTNNQPNNNNNNNNTTKDGTTSTSTTTTTSTSAPLPDNDLAMILIDRNVDMVTPMVTPLTYEGLLDEVIGIDCGFIHVPESTINPDEDDDIKNEKKSSSSSSSTNPFEADSKSHKEHNQVVLGVHAGDTLYKEVRNQHVEQFGTFLQNQAIALKESHANFTNKGTQKDLQQIHQFVKQIPMFTQNLRSLTNHIHLAELIKATTEDVAFREQWQTERSMIEGEVCFDVLEEWIASGVYPPSKVLRLLCLQSLCAGGLKSSRYDSFRAQIVQVYGYEMLPMLHQLETLGWIRRKDTLWMGDSTSGSTFGNLRRSLVLINAEVDTVEPDDVSYVSSGYAPLTVRLVQAAIQGWTISKEDILRELPGRLLDIQQCHPSLDLSTTLKLQTPPKGESLGQYAKNSTTVRRGKKPTLIVVYLGGITYMEIAALRFLSKRDSFPYHIIMVTTRVMNGSTLLKSLE